MDLGAVAILDAGAGPVSSLGKVYKGVRLNNKAVDFLADECPELYRKYNCETTVPTEKGRFLTLSDDLGESRFDLVYSRNSLEHCEDPATREGRETAYVYFL